ncbi:DUF4184 family protein [Kribbella shirazensis]|uniref:DUF4184 family protein n=1 Tax=Kribbella shirazensis TaxID=1105143 RepID=A0A7X5VFY9_9ACTN|nr:hypothetical protein [Kribbella shirazensis]
MPFTLAHPAAVLPLFRQPFVVSALVAGAVAPDLLYVGPLYRIATQYIHGNFTLTLTHKVTSALWLDPLLKLLLLAVFNLVLKRPLVALAPPALAARRRVRRRDRRTAGTHRPGVRHPDRTRDVRLPVARGTLAPAHVRVVTLRMGQRDRRVTHGTQGVVGVA